MPKFGAGNKGTFEITAGVSSIATEETEAVNTAADLLSLLAAISEFDKVVGETLTAGTATGRTTFGGTVKTGGFTTRSTSPITLLNACA
jgi:hypothetical protein